MKVFASGQSNMVGRGTGSMADVDPRVRVWNNVNPLGSPGTAFVSAAEAQSAGTFQLTDRTNLAVHFCDELARSEFADVTLTLVARSSTPIQYWRPTETTYPMLQASIDAWTATGQGPADVFLWHQGENNVNHSAAVYQTEFDALIANLTNAGIIDANTVILMGAIHEAQSTHVTFNRNSLRPLAKKPRRAFVESSGATTFDGVHFDADGLAVLGHRYYEMFRLVR